MAKVLGTKKTERAGVNAFKAAMEAAGHIVQEIDGGNDYGEDCYLSFTQLGRRTGDLAAVQIKSGVKYRRAAGYAIPCREHVEDWTRSRIPVIGVVYDPEMRACYWVNMTEYLRNEVSKGKRPKSVPVSDDSTLDKLGIENMVEEVRQYISDTLGENHQPYSGIRGAISKALDERKHKREQHFASAPIGGHPIPLFEQHEDFLEKHPNFVPRLLTFATYGLMIGVHALMLPGLYQAVSTKHGSFMTVSWLVNFYGLIWFFLMVGRKDSHPRRAALMRGAAYALILSGSYVSYPHYLTSPWPVPSAFEESYIIALPQITKFTALFIGGHYLRLEVSRRRRVAKARQSAQVEE
ncbi:DUF4365 domain-containing protein [Streptomyces sp. NPDC088732]|uniref:DUF4365 domain-containing protein n=1 Tax=Streptomyces sp. NPDC088732 TaxID=3365879 RepID=UPI003812EDE7